MFLESWGRKLPDWGGQRFWIGVMSLEEYLDVLDCVISGIEEICVRCRTVNESTGSNVWNILLDFLHLEVNYLCF